MTKFFQFTTCTLAGAAMLMASTSLHAAEISAGAAESQSVYNSLLTQVEARLAQYKASIGDDISTLQQQLEQQIANNKAAIDLLSTNMAGLETRTTNLENRVTTVEGDINNLKTRLSSSEAAINNLKTEMNAVKADISNLRNSLNNVIARMNTAEGNINNLMTRMNAAEADISSLRNQLYNATVRLNNLEAFANTINTNLNNLSNCSGGYGGRAACSVTTPTLTVSDVKFTGLFENHDWVENGSAKFYGRKSDFKTSEYPYCAVKGGVNLDGVDYQIVKKDGYWAIKAEDAWGQSEGVAMSCFKFN